MIQLSRRVYLLCICFLSLVIHLQGQASHFQVNTISNEEEDYSFPVVAKATDRVAERINTYLQLTELDQLIFSAETKPFSHLLTEEDGRYLGTEYLDYAVERNDSQLISLSFEKSWVGNGYSWGKSFYNFCSQSGEFIHLAALFNDHQRSLVDSVIRLQFLNHIEQLLIDSIVGVNDQENLTELANNFIWSDCGEFILLDEHLVVDVFNHVHRWDQTTFGEYLSFTVTWQELKPYLSAYGEWLLFDHHRFTPKPIIPNHQQVLTGKIGPYPILAVLYQDPAIHGEYLRMKYAYRKYGTALYADGNTIPNAKLQLDEDCEDFLNCPVFFLQWKAEGPIEGLWYSGDGQRELEVRLERL